MIECRKRPVKLKAARAVVRRYPNFGEPYYCRQCEAWHVGHQKTSGERKYEPILRLIDSICECGEYQGGIMTV